MRTKDSSLDSISVQPGAISAVLEELVRAPEPEASAAVLAPGARVGRFEIQREIGRGGFGVVYEARDLELGRKVAFKVVRPGRRRELREGRLLLEAEAAARLSHPNIVTLYDLGRSEHGPYLVLELLRGETIGARLGRGPLLRGEALRIAIEVARGLSYAHAAGVIHRDLSPGNVFLCEDGTVKVLDLGMAHAFGHEKIRGGTPGHMAPEQRDGGAEDARTDVFALGALIVTMLGAEVPEGGLGPGERLASPRRGRLRWVLERMLARDPARRYADAGAALGALRRATPEMERAARQRWIAAGAALAVVAGIALARRPAAIALAGPSLAVLPFEDASPARDQGHVAEGLAAELQADLSRVPGLRVAGHASALKVRALPPQEAAKRLQVASIVTGSIRPGGAGLLIATRLVRGSDGSELWSEEYEAAAGLLSVQEEIARAVSGALRLSLPAPAAGDTAPPAEALDLFWRARQMFDDEKEQRDTEQLALLEQAVALAPRWGRARALLGVVRYVEGMTARREFDAACGAAMADLDEAVRVEPGTGEILGMRGFVRLYCAVDLEGARADVERGLRLDPENADVMRRAGAVYLLSGHPDEAIRAMRRAADLDPLLPRAWAWLARAYYSAGRLGEARTATERALALEPRGWYVALLGQLELEEGRPEKALGYFDRSNPGTRERGRALALHDLGRQAEAQAEVDALRRSFPHTSFGLAEVYTWWGDRERAFEALSRAVEERTATRAELFHDPLLRPLHSDPRWLPMMRRAGFR